MAQSSRRAPAAAALAIGAAVAAAAYVAAYSILSTRRRRTERDAYEARITKLEETRQAERTGRIRAEMRLRSHLKDRDEADADADASGEGDDSAKNDDERKSYDNGKNNAPQRHNLNLQCIGTIVSPYTKRMGTPRQGALVPSGRGFVQLRIPVECVEGLELHSHAWVLFTFHANTDAPTTTSRNNQKQKQNAKKKNNGNESMMINLSKTKIRPPRGNGIKVGMLATRSPHRPNNVGLSLVRIVGVDKKQKRLHLAALDLVNGTPVYDVKPCVPWDVPGHHDRVPLSVPDWVSQDDELKSVRFSDRAREALENYVGDGRLAPLYTSDNDGADAATRTITEILAQDPRASNSNGPNKRGSATSEYRHTNDVYKMIFCSVEVEFRVDGDGVVVEDVRDLDLENVRHVDGIPILLK